MGCSRSIIVHPINRLRSRDRIDACKGDFGGGGSSGSSLASVVPSQVKLSEEDQNEELQPSFTVRERSGHSVRSASAVSCPEPEPEAEADLGPEVEGNEKHDPSSSKEQLEEFRQPKICSKAATTFLPGQLNIDTERREPVQAQPNLLAKTAPPNLGLRLPDLAISRDNLEYDGRPDRTPCSLQGRDYEKALDFVAKVPVLQSLPKSDIPLLVQEMDLEEFLCDDVVIQQGSMSDRLFIILKGEATVTVKRDTGEEAWEIARLGPGEYFGEQELLLAEPAGASVQASGTEYPSLATFSVTHQSFWRLGLHKKLRVPRRKAVVDQRTALSNLRTARFSSKEFPVRSKSPADRELIEKALQANADLCAVCPMTPECIELLIEKAESKTVPKGTVLMKQGDVQSDSSHFYIVQEGVIEIKGSNRNALQGFRQQPLPRSWEGLHRPGESFGELELIYSAPCNATATALEDSKVFVVSHSLFMTILRKPLRARLTSYVETLQRVKIFSSLFREELMSIAETLTEISFGLGAEVTTQGDVGSSFYIITQGEVVEEKDGREVCRYRASHNPKNNVQFFGEEELRQPGPRKCTVRVVSSSATFLALDKASFDLVLEPLDSLNVGEQAVKRIPKVSSQETRMEAALADEVTWWTMALDDKKTDSVDVWNLDILGSLGSGGASCVGLAVDIRTRQKYALKRISRASVGTKWAQKQVLNEKSILSMTNSPFLVSLHQTFRDSSALYFLLEFAPGGDLLHALIRHECYGDLKCAQFYSAGVSLALGHLHARRIIHRDVKPENILLDEHGWPKVTDFGIAKFCVGRTFTVCGTPNYLAPETLLQLGQTEAVDWWALGVFTYEMVAGRTPFERTGEDLNADLMKTFAAIQRGLVEPESWPWPQGFGPELRSFVASILRPRPADRLPMWPGGMKNLQRHSWFRDIDWVSYEARILEPPLVPVVDSELPTGFEPVNPEDEPWHSFRREASEAAGCPSPKTPISPLPWDSAF